MTHDEFHQGCGCSFCENWRDTHKDQFRAIQSGNVKAARLALRQAFTWGESREGHDYWYQIHERLREIERSGS